MGTIIDLTNVKAPKSTKTAAKKAPAKKATKVKAKAKAKKSSAPRAHRGMPERSEIGAKVVKAFASWKKGDSLNGLATALKMTKRQLRKEFAVIAGGYPKLHSLRKHGAGAKQGAKRKG
jgi:hypothetical protein